MPPEVDAPPSPPPPSRKRKKGRTSDPVWSELFRDADLDGSGLPLAMKTQCMHCKTSVQHSKKPDRAKNHRSRCNAYSRWIRQGRSSSIAPSDSASCVSTGNRGRQKSVQEYFPPPLNPVDQSKFEKEIAMYFLTSGTPYIRVENRHLLRAVQTLRPDAQLPNRKKIGGALLNECYEEVKAEVEKRIDPSTAFCLSTDAWTNINHDAIINFVMSQPEMTLYVGSIATKNASHNANYLSEKVSEVIRKFENNGEGGYVAGCVTDSTKANKRAAEHLEKNFPDKYFYFCGAHVLNLLLKDICDPSRTLANAKLRHDAGMLPEQQQSGRSRKRKQMARDVVVGEDEYSEEGTAELDLLPELPPNYPFQDLITVFEEANTVSAFFKNHSMLKAELNALQKDAGKGQLVRWGATRWGSRLGALTSIRKSEQELQMVVSASSFLNPKQKQPKAALESRKEIQRILRSDEFQRASDRACAVLRPVDRLIKEWQSDSLPLSQLHVDFDMLWAIFDPEEPPLDPYEGMMKPKRKSFFEDCRKELVSLFKRSELRYIHGLAVKRWNGFYRDVHGLALFLDPRYLALETSVETRRACQAMLGGKVLKGGKAVDKAAVDGEIMRFRTQCQKDRMTYIETGGAKPQSLKSLVEGTIGVKEWWYAEGGEWRTLQQIALPIFSLSASSVSAERNFSLNGFFHSKLRNRLSTESVEKQMYVKMNSAAMWTTADRNHDEEGEWEVENEDWSKPMDDDIEE